MTAVTIPRPAAGEYNATFEAYLSQVPPGDVFPLLARSLEETLAPVTALTDAEADYRYAPGKWSVKEIVGHLADAERIFAYRALVFARGERQPQPGFDENAYVAAAKFSARPLAGLVAELRAVRAATLALFGGLDAEELTRRGVANGRECDARTLAAVIVGHERHHAAVLAERYYPAIRRARAGG
ncbi:MAG TPA: DinB family protein [Gemmatimonadales bacterium]|nr:DinB family protein [Gemmatimonadales bacterium]